MLEGMFHLTGSLCFLMIISYYAFCVYTAWRKSTEMAQVAELKSEAMAMTTNIVDLTQKAKATKAVVEARTSAALVKIKARIIEILETQIVNKGAS